MMPELDLDAVKALCDAATPGPWERYAGSPKTRYIVAPNVEHIDVDEADWGPEVGNVLAVGTLHDPRAWRYADVEFIAQSRTLVPALAAEVERLRTERDAGVRLLRRFKARLDAVMALHQPEPYGNCIECSCDHPIGGVDYPCPTVRAASGEAGDE